MCKAVLIMDMPEGCAECKCYDFVNCACKAFEMAGEEDIYECPDEGETKPDWCPLTSLPEKKEPTMRPLSPLLSLDYTPYEKGWNECIDEITGDVDSE